MEQRQNTMSKAANDTCGWLHDHSTFKAWQEKLGMIWIKGNPGTGKSTLMKYTIRRFEREMPESTLVIKFFFHGRGSELQKSLLGLLGR